MRLLLLLTVVHASSTYGTRKGILKHLLQSHLPAEMIAAVDSFLPLSAAMDLPPLKYMGVKTHDGDSSEEHDSILYSTGEIAYDATMVQVLLQGPSSVPDSFPFHGHYDLRNDRGEKGCLLTENHHRPLSPSTETTIENSQASISGYP